MKKQTLGSVLKMCITFMLGAALALLGVCCVKHQQNAVEGQSHSVAQRGDLVAQPEAILRLTAKTVVDRIAWDLQFNPKQLQCYPDFPFEVERMADYYYCYQTNDRGALIRTLNSVRCYKDEQLVQEWCIGERPAKRFMMSDIGGCIYIVEDETLMQLQPDGGVNVLPGRIMDAARGYGYGARSLHVLILDGAELTWRIYDTNKVSSTLIVDGLNDIQEAGFACQTIVVVTSGGSYIWLQDTFRGEFSPEELHTLAQIGEPESIEYWKSCWQAYAQSYDYVCLSHFFAFCTTLLYRSY